MIIGQPGLDDSLTNPGSAFIFLGNATLMDQNGFWNPPGAQPGAKFGASVAAGDVNGDGLQDVIVGEPQWDDGSGVEVGRVHVYFGQP